MKRFFLVTLALLAPVFLCMSAAEARIEVLTNPSHPPARKYAPSVTPNPSSAHQFPANVVVPPFYLPKGGEVWVYKNHHFYPAFPRGFLKDYHRRAH